MLLRGKRVEELSSEDIVSLIDNRIPESLILDYKRDFKLKDDGDRSELLADITAFFNTEGGIILFGLEDERDELKQSTGIPKIPSDNKVDIENFDKTKSQIEEIVRNNTDPQLNHLSFSELLTIDGCKVFAISIPKNLSLPTRVSFKNSSKFYRRRNTGKYLLDTHELYQAFVRQMEMKEKVEQFITERCHEFKDNGLVNINSDWPSVLFHFIPLNHWENNFIETFSDNGFSYQAQGMLRPMKATPNISDYYCYEGLLLLYEDNYLNSISYNLLFRNGILESFTDSFFGSKRNAISSTSFYGIDLARELIDLIKNNLAYLALHNIEPPYVISMKLENLKGLNLIGERNFIKGEFKRNIIQLPPSTIYDPVKDIPKIFLTWFDIIWQSVGNHRCEQIIRDIINNPSLKFK